MSDQITTKVIDTEWEHSMHTAYEKNCSECYRENRLIRSRNIVNKVNWPPVFTNSKHYNGDIYPPGYGESQ